MSLNSWQFILLASCAVLLLPLARGHVRTAVFLALNVAFVWTYWGVGATPLAVGFLLLGYALARAVTGRGTATLVVSLTVLTGVFVYLRGYSLGAAATPATTSVGLVAIAGVSFLFFKMVHVVVDAASGTIEALSFSRYLNYCLNFTTVLMGPIQRFQDFSSQWTTEPASRALPFEPSIDAANRVLLGMFKAFVVAPYLAPHVLRPGLPLDSIDGGELMLRTYAFYVFLYLDFSGYCDIMIGIGTLMGIRPPENFNFPFLARNVSAYWLRVHRSLTQWLTDYIFTPAYKFALGVSALARHGFLALAASLMLTMLVAGIWHGPTPNFVVFGLVHGAALVVMRGYDQAMMGWLGRARFRRFEERPLVAAAAVFLTYNFTSLAYVFFVLDVDEGVRVLGRLATIATGLVL